MSSAVCVDFTVVHGTVLLHLDYRKPAAKRIPEIMSNEQNTNQVEIK